MPYADLRDYLGTLERKGLLSRVAAEVDKDWEIAAVVRRVFQRIPTERRPALLFENVRGHTAPVAVGILGGSPTIYATALGSDVAGITERWQQAQASPIPPVEVATGVCQEVILEGDAIDLTRLPIPTWTVEHDPGPFITAPCVITRDPETGVGNVGTYRMQLKGPRRAGIGGFHLEGTQHFTIHFRKYRARRERMPVAVALGADPTVGLTSVTRLPYGLDELAVAGGLRGEALPVVAARTVPLHVPATAEYVLEGWIDPEDLEHEGPFGELTGYMGSGGESVVLELSCLTHRRDPIYHAFLSQMPPSESSCIRGIGRAQQLRSHLVRVLGLPVQDVYWAESGGSSAYLLVALRKDYETQPQQVMWAVWSAYPQFAKWIVVVDDDIDIRDSFQVEWALSFRVQPQRDIYIYRDTLAMNLDPTQAPFGVPTSDRARLLGSKVGVDATRKHEYPPASLPPREHLARVDAQWERYGIELP
jgi:UbiD family decarboxylase